MKQAVLIALSIMITAVASVLLVSMVFFFIWGLGDFTFFDFPAFIGLWIMGLLTLGLAFIVPFLACRPLGDVWWINSSLVIGPTMLLLGKVICDNMDKGGVLLEIILVMNLVVAASFTGGLVGRKRTPSNNGGNPIPGPAPFRDAAPEKGHE